MTPPRPSLTTFSAVLVAIAVAVATGLLVGRIGSAPDIRVLVSEDAYALGAAPGYTSGGEPWLMAGAGGGHTAVTFLKFAVATLPGGDAPRRAEIRLTRAGGPLPPHVELTYVPSNRWRETTLTAGLAPRLGRVLASARPDPLDGTVTFDVTRIVTRPGTFSFAVTAPAGSGLAQFIARDADRSLARALQPVLWLSAAGRPGPRNTPPPRSTPSDSPSPSPVDSPVEPTPTLMPEPPADPVPTPSPYPTWWPAPTDEPSPTSTSEPEPDPGCTVGDLLVPTCGVLWGVAPGAHTNQPRDEALNEFERDTGRPQAIYHAYHRGDELFPTPEEVAIAREDEHPRILFLNWKPRVSWARVARGDADDFLDRLAEHIQTTLPEPFFFTVHHEPENDVRSAAGSGMTAQDYAAMYRHVIERLRADGVTNLVSVIAYMAYVPWNTKSWFDDLYPGDDVVDWVAWDTYAYSEPGYGYGDFAELMNRRSGSRPGWPGFYDWAAFTFPDKPLMVAEWGVWYSGRNPGHMPYFFDTVAQQIPLFPRVKALVYFDTPNNQKGWNSAVDTTPAGLSAYRRLGLDPTFQVVVG